MLLLLLEISSSVSHPYSELVARDFTCTGGLTTGGVDGSCNTGQINFSTVPEKIFLFVAPSNPLLYGTQEDLYAQILTLTVRTNNDNGGFTGADPAQLYTMCKRNGLSSSWTQFNDFQGGVLCLDISKGDLSGYVAGTNMEFSMSIDVTFANRAYSGWNYVEAMQRADRNGLTPNGTDVQRRVAGNVELAGWRLYMYAVNSGQLIIEQDSTFIQIGHAKAETSTAMDNMQKGEFVNTDVDVENSDGGGFFRSFHRQVRSAIKYAPKIIKAGQTALKKAEEVSDAYNKLTASGLRLRS